MALVALNKQPPGWKSPDDWLVVLMIDLITFWDIRMKHKRSLGLAIWLCFTFVEILDLPTTLS